MNASSTDTLTMTIPEVARALRISRGLAYDLARRKALPVPVIKVGSKRLVVSKVAVERLLTLTGERIENG